MPACRFPGQPQHRIAALAQTLRGGIPHLLDQRIVETAGPRAAQNRERDPSPIMGIWPTVITHSPTIAAALVEHPAIDVFLIGGQLFKHSAVTCGAAAAEAAQTISAGPPPHTPSWPLNDIAAVITDAAGNPTIAQLKRAGTHIMTAPT